MPVSAIVALGVLCAVLLLCFLMLVRNQIVYKARIKAIDISYRATRESISRSYPDYINFQSRRDSFGTYDRMLYDLRKWKYEHFYPGFTYEELEKEINK